jgi:hypothetical protein
VCRVLSALSLIVITYSLVAHSLSMYHFDYHPFPPTDPIDSDHCSTAPFEQYACGRDGIEIIREIHRCSADDRALPSYIHAISSPSNPLPPLPYAALHRYLEQLVALGPVSATSSLVSPEIHACNADIAQYISGNDQQLQHFRDRSVGSYMASLFYHIALCSPAVVELDRWDLYHAHIISCAIPTTTDGNSSVPSSSSPSPSPSPSQQPPSSHKVECDLAMIFHAKEFPREFRTRKSKVYPIGAEQMGGNRDPRRGTKCSTFDLEFPYRNYMWLMSTNQLYLFDPLSPDCPKGLVAHHEFLTVNESFFMARTVGSINYLPDSTGVELPGDLRAVHARLLQHKHQWFAELASQQRAVQQCEHQHATKPQSVRQYYRLDSLMQHWNAFTHERQYYQLSTRLVHGVAEIHALNHHMLVWAIDGMPVEWHISRALVHVQSAIDQCSHVDLTDMLLRLSRQQLQERQPQQQQQQQQQQEQELSNSMPLSHDHTGQHLPIAVIPFVRFLAQQRIEALATNRKTSNQRHLAELISLNIDATHAREALEATQGSLGDWSAFRAQELLQVLYPQYRNQELLAAVGQVQYDAQLCARVWKHALFADVTLSVLGSIAQAEQQVDCIDDAQLNALVRQELSRQEHEREKLIKSDSE